MDNESSKEIQTSLEKKLFWKFARYHLDEMRLLFRGGRLSRKEGDWNNVIDHCLVQAAGADAFSSLLGLSEDEQNRLRVAALCHDWKKRLENTPEDFTDEQKIKAQELLKKASPDQKLMRATELGFSKTILEGKASLSQELLFYIDDFTSGSKIVRLEDRISETEARTNLDQDQRLTEELGGPHWDIERLAARQVEQKLYFMLKERGVNIDIPQNMPLLIKKKVEEIASVNPKESTKSPKFKISVLNESQPEGGNRKNEDTLTVLENDQILVAAVFDGATSLSTLADTNIQVGQGGWFAAQFAAIGIEKNYRVAESAEDLLLAANNQIASVLESQGVNVQESSPHQLSAASATVIRIDKTKKTLEVAQLQDTACLIEKKDDTFELSLPLEVPEEDFQALKLAKEIASGSGISLKEAVANPQVVELIAKGRARNNQPDGTGVGVLDGRNDAQNYIRTKGYNLNEVSKIVLLTDGLFSPNQDINAESDWEEILEIIDKKGLDGLYRYVLEMKNADPDLNKYPRFKKHDDATGIVIDLVN